MLNQNKLKGTIYLENNSKEKNINNLNLSKQNLEFKKG